MSKSIYTEEIRILNAQNFISGLTRTTPSADNAYLYIGRSFPWIEDSNSGELNPPDVEANLNYELDVRSEWLAMKRITGSDIVHVIPRIDWETGTVYDEYSPSTNILFQTDFYVLTDDFFVYKCLDNNGGGQSTVKPTGTGTTPINTADGYTWKFMYDIPAALATKFLTLEWMPVPTGGSKSSLQLAVEAAATYTAGEPLGGHGSNAFRELGAFHVMVNTRLVGDESGKFPIGDDFRRVGMVLNPLLADGSTPATASAYIASDDSVGEIDNLSGRILYQENRVPIIRNVDQVEDIKIILTF